MSNEPRIETGPASVADLSDVERVSREVADDIQNSTVDESQPSPPPEGDSQESGISDEILSRAKGLGFSEDDLQGLSSDQAGAIIDRAESAAFQRFRSLQGQSGQFDTMQMPWQQQQQPQQPVAPPRDQFGRFISPGQPPQFQQQPPPQQPQRFQLPNPDDLDESNIVGTFKQMQEYYDSQLSQMNNVLQQQQEQYRLWEEQQQADYSAWFDRSLSGVGDGSVFGKGDYNSISEQEYFARQQAYRDYQAYLQFNGLPPNTRNDELLARVVQLTRGGGQSDVRKKISDELKDRGKKVIGRPSAKKPSLDDSNRDPMTGVSQSTIDLVAKRLESYQQS